LRIVAGTMTPRQTIRLSGVISCARHEELGQRLAVNSFTVVRLKYSKRRQSKSTIFHPNSRRQSHPVAPSSQILLAGIPQPLALQYVCGTSHPLPAFGIQAGVSLRDPSLGKKMI
jgi:hypothetical protein